MLIGIKPENADRENRIDLILLALFIANFFVAVCALSFLLISPPKEPRPSPKQATSVTLKATAAPPTAMPVSLFTISFPSILSGSGYVPEQIWRVIKIKNLGYELGGQRYDLVIFKRVDSQETVKAYCINRGWDIPDIGHEYLLNADGIFVPIHEPNANPLQRFLVIQ